MVVAFPNTHPPYPQRRSCAATSGTSATRRLWPQCLASARLRDNRATLARDLQSRVIESNASRPRATTRSGSARPRDRSRCSLRVTNSSVSPVAAQLEGHHGRPCQLPSSNCHPPSAIRHRLLARSSRYETTGGRSETRGDAAWGDEGEWRTQAVRWRSATAKRNATTAEAASSNMLSPSQNDVWIPSDKRHQWKKNPLPAKPRALLEMRDASCCALW